MLVMKKKTERGTGSFKIISSLVKTEDKFPSASEDAVERRF